VEPVGHKLLRSLAKIVGEDYVSDDDFVLYSYSRDSSPFPERVPGVVVRPSSAEEVSAVVALANRSGTPVIPWRCVHRLRDTRWRTRKETWTRTRRP
jgi:glycolate oxidase